jgi:hypothetical protein
MKHCICVFIFESIWASTNVFHIQSNVNYMSPIHKTCKIGQYKVRPKGL